MVPGGHTAVRHITPQLQSKVLSIKSSIEAELGGKTFDGRFEATHFRTQVVAGTVYHFKIMVSDTDAVHVKVYEPLPFTGDPIKIMAIKKAKKDDELAVM